MSKPKRKKSTLAAPIIQVMGALGKHSKPGWLVSMPGQIQKVMAECPKLSERQVFLAYDELCKPPFEYLKKCYQIVVHDHSEHGDDDTIEFSATAIAEARKDGELFDPQRGVKIEDWEERLQVVYWATDKFPEAPASRSLDDLVTAVYAYRDKEISGAKLGVVWRKFCDLHGLEG